MDAFRTSEGHRLVREQRRVAVMQQQAPAVALMLLLGVAAWLIDLAWAPTLTLASAAVLTAMLAWAELSGMLARLTPPPPSAPA